MRFPGWLLVLACGGCGLYFGEPESSELGRTLDTDAAVAEPIARCPAQGTYAEITYPLDGATNVPTPVPIAMHVYIPNTLDGKGIYLTAADGQPVPLSQWREDCSVPIAPIQTGPVQDLSWTACYDLPPASQFTWHIWITCYDESGSHEIVTSTFRTAPAPDTN